jgi:hypothetical protein
MTAASRSSLRLHRVAIVEILSGTDIHCFGARELTVMTIFLSGLQQGILAEYL